MTKRIAEAIELLQNLIRIPSFSEQEDKTADLIGDYLQSQRVAFFRLGNNIWAINRHFRPKKPVLLLNSHHDTVNPNKGYTRDPFTPEIVDGKLYGLGSNDAGGPLVSLLATFMHFYERADLPFNLIYAASAEEENSGPNGIELIIPHLGRVDCAIVGEPTQMQLAIAEKGLMVLDCLVRGRAGHAAREEGENAIYKALPDIEWFKNHSFPMVSEFLGAVKMTVTIIQAGQQHNVVPDEFRFTVDVRVNECYSMEQVLEIVRQHVSCEVTPRSLRMRSSIIPPEHPLVQSGIALGRTIYGSPTCSDKALMPFPALKMGPGDSARSHTADEFIFVEEIEKGVAMYVALLEGYGKQLV
ncbi:MAG: M20 family metallo-hydrolase [Bacteroidota bacterium]